MKRTRLARRIPLVAKTPLKPGAPLVRHTPTSQGSSELRSKSAPTKRSGPLKQGRGHQVPGSLRKALVKRSGGMCEVALVDVCAGQATDFQHRVNQGSGGVHGAALAASDRLSNGLHGCRPCHGWIHDNPEAAQREFVGWSVRRGADPAQVAVLYRGRVVWLTDDGRVIEFEEGAA